MLALRALLNSAFVALSTIFGSLTALMIWPFDRAGAVILQLARVWSRAVLAFSGIRIQVEQRGTLDPGRAYVFMANHLSAVDIWAIFVAVPIPVRMIAKKQLAAIPLFGWAMMAGRFIFIDRQNAPSARRSIERARDRIRGGDSVVIFPEGTRSRDGSLQPFKKGGFHLAIEAGVPVVPVALTGTREAMPRGSLLLRPGRVRVSVGEPIPTEGLSTENRHQLLGRVRAAMADLLHEHDPEIRIADQ